MIDGERRGLAKQIVAGHYETERIRSEGSIQSADEQFILFFPVT
jgi:hypothetical protein